MKIQRSKNASRNIIYGIVFRVFQTIVPFIIRTIMIYSLGMQYVGLNGLFTSILHVLNVAEMGVGHAMIYSMYKPIAEDDTDKINKLLNIYKKYYRGIGLLILTAGLLILPILPKLIEGDVPQEINLYAIYLLTLATTVSSYWLFSYKNSLLTAHQRNDTYTKIQMAVYVVQYLLQGSALAIFENYYLFLVCALLGQILSNVIVLFVTNKMYPNYKASGRLPTDETKEINHRIRDLFTAKLGGTVTNSADTVVISAFLGLTLLAKYNNYFYILTALFGFVTIIFQSCQAGIGNSLVVETAEKNYVDFNLFSMIMLWVIGLMTAMLLVLFQPFMLLWVHEENMLDNSYAIMFSIYFYIYEIPMIWATYKDAGGIWHEDRFRPLTVTAVNLSLNLLTVQTLGLYGVILSTIISYLFVGMPWMLHNIFKCLFHRSAKEYVKKIIYISGIAFVACSLSYFLCNLIVLGGVTGMICKGLTVFVVVNLIYLIGYLPLNDFPKMRKYVFSLLKRYIHKF
ncbi:MAG: oligosaccharide flippase family protein [Eubacteriales bacterium]|nr:oligosaccharide flippase family protein [Eubacteriales bacterium]